MRLEQVIDRRDDVCLGRVPDGVVSATPTVLTRWDVDRVDRTVRESATMVASEPRPGPLTWLEEANAVGWGPSVVRGGAAGPVSGLVAAALADAGDGASRWFRLVTGAVDRTGALAAVVVEQRPPKARPEHAPRVDGPSTRGAVVEGSSPPRLVDVLVDGARGLTTMAWGDGPLVIGAIGRVLVWTGVGTARELDLVDSSAARAVAVGRGGEVAAGTATGRVVTFAGSSGPTDDGWAAHSAPVVALAWRPDDVEIATGGLDGWLRVWRGGELRGEIELGDAVHAVAWLDERRLVAKAGALGGRLAVVRTDD